MTPPIKAPSFARSANCPFPQDCFKWQEDCASFTTEDWLVAMIGKSEMIKRSRTKSLSTQNSVLLEIASFPRTVSFRPRKSNLSVLYAADILHQDET